MHFENVVAHGADPVAIDLETLFHADTTALEPKNATEAVFAEVRDSVMAIGILPTPVLNAKNEAYDGSGFGGNAGQQTPYSVLSLQNLGKDDLRFGHAPATIKGTHNQPRANINRLLASASLLKGFEESCFALLEIKAQLLSTQGPIEAFARDKVRLVIRPTSTYGTLLVDSTHPDFIKNELDRTRHWLQLFAAVPFRPELLKFIRSEINQLSVGDVPYFAFVPDSRFVFGGDGSEIQEGLIQTGLEKVRTRIREMTPEEIRRQTWFIRSSLGYTEGFYRGPSSSSSTPLEMAAEAGNEVLRNLIVNGEMATALNIACLSSDPQSDRLHFAIQPAGDGLYDGTGGHALFLAYLASQTGEVKFKAAAERLLNHILKLDDPRSRHSISAFSGRAARIYLLTHLGALWNRADLLDEAEKCLEGLPEMIDKDRVFDIISGTAGCLLATLALAEARPEGPAGNVAQHAGLHLLKVFDQDKRSWEQAPFQRGFSHGASGISYALARLHEANGDKQFLEGAIDAAHWEDALIQDEHWTDRHHTNGHHQVSWCHGAPGIALARLALPESGTLQKALAICRHEPSGSSHCLCHGTLGNIEPLLQTNQLDERSRTELFERVVPSLREHGWRSTLANQTLSDGLLTGVSGIGYGLLRLANADRVPSVLTLEGIKKAQRRI
jgi:type 2 lantibiotic biosynthesis protein LanM